MGKIKIIVADDPEEWERNLEILYDYLCERYPDERVAELANRAMEASKDPEIIWRLGEIFGYTEDIKVAALVTEVVEAYKEMPEIVKKIIRKLAYMARDISAETTSFITRIYLDKEVMNTIKEIYRKDHKSGIGVALDLAYIVEDEAAYHGRYDETYIKKQWNKKVGNIVETYSKKS